MYLIYYLSVLFFLGSYANARMWTPSEIPHLGNDIWVSDPDSYMSQDQLFKINHL